jgi:hypothetical protein
MTQIKTKWMAVALLGVLAGASGSAAPAWALGDCEVTGCGSNTPVLFGTPIGGLSTVGLANNRGVVLDSPMTRAVPAPATAVNPCPDGALVGVANGELIGRWQGNTCVREGLIGMVLSMKVPMVPCGQRLPHTLPVPCGETAVVRARVAQVSTVKTWALVGQETLISYQLVWHELLPPRPELTEELVLGQSICPSTTGGMDEWQTMMPSSTSGGIIDSKWKEPTDHLVIVQGETYFDDATIDPGRKGASWLNLACVGSALAKSRMLANDPMEAGPWQLRQSTLKMLTGRYLDAQSFTRRGIPLSYQRFDGKQFYGSPEPARVSVEVESYWDEHGAICLSHRRTWLQGAVEKGESVVQAFWRWLTSAQPESETIGDRLVLLPPPSALPSLYQTSEEPSLLPLRARGLAPCDDVPDDYFWVTRPVDHVAH